MSTNNQSLSENLIAFGIALVVFTGLYLIKPVYPFQPHGIALPALEKMPAAVQRPLQVYTDEPNNFQTLANINVEGHTLNPNAQQQEQMIDYAIKLAAKFGANGLIVHMGYEAPSSDTPTPLAKMVLFGKAINVP